MAFWARLGRFIIMHHMVFFFVFLFMIVLFPLWTLQWSPSLWYWHDACSNNDHVENNHNDNHHVTCHHAVCNHGSNCMICDNFCSMCFSCNLNLKRSKYSYNRTHDQLSFCLSWAFQYSSGVICIIALLKECNEQTNVRGHSLVHATDRRGKIWKHGGNWKK
jgi:hypothetical protein